jgi:colanic acid biosynthesis protein WcaH
MRDLSAHDFDMVRRHAPLVSIDMIIRDASGRVLLGRRTNEPAKGVWFVPGGRVQKDERLAAAFVRLLQEELGNPRELGISEQLADATFMGVYEHLYPVTPATPFTIHYVVLGYELRAAASAGAALPASQHDEWRWWDVEALLKDNQVHANTKAYFAKP